MRTCIITAAAIGLLLTLGGNAQAQNSFVYKPIDGTQITQPTDAAAKATGNVALTTIQTLSRSVAASIDNNGFVKTINNVLGKRAANPTVQAGYSPLPLVSSYKSQTYASSFKAMKPINSTFGKTPKLTLPTAVSPSR